MGFDIMGLHIWDLSQPFGYVEAFSGIIFVLLCAGVTLCVLKYFAPKA